MSSTLNDYSMGGTCNTCLTDGVCNPSNASDPDCSCSSPEVVSGTNYYNAHCSGNDVITTCNAITVTPNPLLSGQSATYSCSGTNATGYLIQVFNATNNVVHSFTSTIASGIISGAYIQSGSHIACTVYGSG